MDAPQSAPAGLGSRAFAFLIDWHIRFVAAAAWFAVALLLGPALDAGIEEFWLTMVLPAALIYLLYHPVLEIATRGSSPGKRWVGLRIVAADGSPPGVGALLLRNVLRVVDSLPVFYGLGLAVMLCRRDQLRVGDLVAGTRVVHQEPAAAAPVSAR